MTCKYCDNTMLNIHAPDPNVPNVLHYHCEKCGHGWVEDTSKAPAKKPLTKTATTKPEGKKGEDDVS